MGAELYTAARILFVTCLSLATVRLSQQLQPQSLGIESFLSKLEEVMAENQQEPGFSCWMETDKSLYEPKEPVHLTFHLTNNNPKDMYVLTWHTPLEGVRNHFLTVTVDGDQDVPYRGVLLKRGNPSASSYQLVPAGGTVSAEVLLQDGYSTVLPGHYVLEMRPDLWDVIPKVGNKELVPHKLNQMQRVPMACKPVEFDVGAK